MEDILSVFKHVENLQQELEDRSKEFLDILRLKFSSTAATVPTTKATALVAAEHMSCTSPQQTNKRAKRLTALKEDDETTQKRESNALVSSTRNSKLLDSADAMEQDVCEKTAPAAMPEPIVAPRAMVIAGAASQEENTEVSYTITTAPVVEEHEFLRPQRAAKLKIENKLKEPSLHKKMRRPSNINDTLLGVNVKLEHEQRLSQMHNASSTSTRSKKSNASIKSNDDASLVIAPSKVPSIVEVETEPEDGDEELEIPKTKINSNGASSQNDERQLRVKIKREKLSASSAQEPACHANEAIAMKEAPTVPLPKNIIKLDPAVDQEYTLENNATVTSSSNTTTTVAPSTKKGKKKKLGPHRPIKVERLSDIIANPSPISSRTRQGSVGRTQRQASVYEDAVAELPATEKLPQSTENAETPPTRYSQVPKDVAIVAGVNETVTIAPSNTTMTVGTNDATFQVDAVQTTFVMPNNNSSPNATVTLSKEAIPGCDATFNISEERQQVVPRRSPSKDNQSMVTARKTSKDDSLITEDESFEPPVTAKLPPPATNKIPTSAKAYRMPTRTHELFNPLVQSPVKKKVEAFEELGKPGKSKRIKENAIPTPTQFSYKTPAIGKQTVPSYGRFLTPTQTSNITPLATAQTNKLASSASKVMPFPKSVSSSSIKSATSSAKAATLSRENSGEDFRRLAEERKKQREQKHLLAAQQREAKEKERAERMAKLAKEREEKRIKKQMEQEQKKKQLDDIQRKLKQQEQETDLLKKAQAQARAATPKTIQEQERELLQQMKPPKPKAPVPLPPKFETKYTFEMLHEDDSTDDEEKVTYKRPAPPTWSRSNMRGSKIHMQQCWPTDIIDSFFSVQPMTPDLKLIFPNIDERHLKRNSSVFWSTPPRYSELPKY